MLTDKKRWIDAFVWRLIELQPTAKHGLSPQIGETFWYFLRHQPPWDVAEARAQGSLSITDRHQAWVDACSEALQRLDPLLTADETAELAGQLWNEDPLRTVDPYLMATALWDQAITVSQDADHEGLAVNPHLVFRSLPRS